MFCGENSWKGSENAGPRPLAIAAVATAAIGSITWVATAPAKPFAKDDPRLVGSGDPARGRLVFATSDCASCHAAPGQQDRLRLGGGLALASPYGNFRVPNISSDPVDGIGTFSVVELANALVAGISPKGQHYYPAFPYTSFTSRPISRICLPISGHWRQKRAFRPRMILP